MIYIDPARVAESVTQQWKERAASALAELRSLPPSERAAAIERLASIWRELSESLASVSGRKCWYCESREVRSDSAVDHFRPKRRVAEAPDHPGYWWLAFDWSNYRYSCTFCNSLRRNRRDKTVGGKQDHFPLVDETARVYDESGDLARETPALLDPMCAADTVMLYFREDGYAGPRFNSTERAVHHSRAATSIKLYHLNHQHTIEARLALCVEVRRLIHAGKLFVDEYNAGSQSARTGLDDVVRKLRELIANTAPYSAAVRDMVRGFRDDRHPWIESI